LWRRLGLEWLYRLIHQPWRWRRMLALPRFVLAVAAQKFGGKQKLEVRN
jgi:N-acetylglucosaminyldiphosphoundecaprenol N-acetyl-beta-D-mannosaminyltransferase